MSSHSLDSIIVSLEGSNFFKYLKRVWLSADFFGVLISLFNRSGVLLVVSDIAFSSSKKHISHSNLCRSFSHLLWMIILNLESSIYVYRQFQFLINIFKIISLFNDYSLRSYAKNSNKSSNSEKIKYEITWR